MTLTPLDVLAFFALFAAYIRTLDARCKREGWDQRMTLYRSPETLVEIEKHVSRRAARVDDLRALCRQLNAAGDDPRWMAKRLDEFINKRYHVDDGVNSLDRWSFDDLFAELRKRLARLQNGVKAEVTGQRCRRCPAQILGVKTAKGGWMPVDFESSERGNIRLNADGTADVLGKQAAAEARARGEGLHVSHFVTCPRAAEFRKRRKA